MSVAELQECMITMLSEMKDMKAQIMSIHSSNDDSQSSGGHSSGGHSSGVQLPDSERGRDQSRSTSTQRSRSMSNTRLDLRDVKLVDWVCFEGKYSYFNPKKDPNHAYKAIIAWLREARSTNHEQQVYLAAMVTGVVTAYRNKLKRVTEEYSIRLSLVESELKKASQKRNELMRTNEILRQEIALLKQTLEARNHTVASALQPDVKTAVETVVDE